MKYNYRLFCGIAALLCVSFQTLLAQSVYVSDILPLGTGQYVDYNQYDTASSGSAAQVSHSSYTVTSSGLTFERDTGVSLVRDSLGSGDPTGIHDLHYRFDAAGNLQVFADSALLASMLPSTVNSGSTPPNAWVDKYRTDTASNQYPIMTINSTYQTIPVVITITGKYDGADNITVGGGNYQAYKFEIVAVISSAIGNLTLDESDWIAPGIGIIRTNMPINSITVPVLGLVSAGGRDDGMIAYGPAPSSVSQNLELLSSIQFFPNPASDNVTLSVDRAANHVFLYDATGRMVRSFEIATRTGDALLWVKDLPNGAYLARVQCVDGSVQQAHFMIQH